MDTSVSGSPGVYGFEELRRNIFNLIRALPGEIKRAQIIEETGTLELAQSRTPVKTGDLKASGHLGEYEVSGYESSIPIIFGTELTYAIYVHENLQAKHTVGQAKFLESAVLDRILDKSKRIGEIIKLERLIR
jgi:hypothetical protein